MSNALIDRYLRDLDRALEPLPAGRRREIVEQVEAHIRDKLAEFGSDPSEAAVRQALEEIGDPQTIAASALEGFDIEPVRAGPLELFALIFLEIGGFIIPFVGWFIGLALLWFSRVWSTRDKLLGTFVVPGGLASVVYLAIFFPAGGSCSVSMSTSGNMRLGERVRITQPSTECDSSYWLPPWAMFVILGVAVLASLAAGIYLGVKAGKSRRRRLQVALDGVA